MPCLPQALNFIPYARRRSTGPSPSSSRSPRESARKRPGRRLRRRGEMGRNLCAQGFGFGVFRAQGLEFRDVELLELFYVGGLEPVLPQHLLPWRPDPSQSRQSMTRSGCRLGRRKMPKSGNPRHKFKTNASHGTSQVPDMSCCPYMNASSSITAQPTP